MATSYPLLADEIAAAIGHPGDVTIQVEGFAHGILDELTMNGTATFGNMASGHTISGMTAASLAAKIQGYAGYPHISAELLNFSAAVVDHIQGAGIVTYTGPPMPPGSDWFLGGTISGLSGSVLAALIQSYVGYPSVTTELLGMATAVTDHIMSNAEVVSGVIS